MFVARPAADVEQFPQSIVVGIDGSEQSARAVEIARALADRLESQLRLVAAEGGKGVDREAVERIAPDAEVMPGCP